MEWKLKVENKKRRLAGDTERNEEIRSSFKRFVPCLNIFFSCLFAVITKDKETRIRSSELENSLS